jgi:WD40 repeat protein
VAISPDGHTILTVGEDRSVIAWTLAGDQTRLHQLMSPPGIAGVFIPGKKEIAACDGGTIVVMDLGGGKRHQMVNPRGGIACLVADPDGKHLLAGNTDGTLRWWNIASEKEDRTFDVTDLAGGVTAVSVAPDGKTAAAGTPDGTVHLWNMVSGTRLRKWKAHGAAVTAVAFDPGGKRLASAGADRTASVWNADSGKLVAKLTGAPESILLSVAWQTNGKRVVAAGVDRNVRHWNAATGKVEAWSAVAEGKVNALVVDPLDRFVLAATTQGTVDRLPLTAAKSSD